LAESEQYNEQALKIQESAREYGDNTRVQEQQQLLNSLVQSRQMDLEGKLLAYKLSGQPFSPPKDNLTRHLSDQLMQSYGK